MTTIVESVTNEELINSYQQQYYNRNRNVMRNYQKTYYDNNKDRILAKAKKRRMKIMAQNIAEHVHRTKLTRRRYYKFLPNSERALKKMEKEKQIQMRRKRDDEYYRGLPFDFVSKFINS